MPKFSNYKNYDLSFHKQQTFGISTFYGVDYNPAQLNVANYHATDIQNFVFKDKVLQKRRGFEQLAKIKPISYKTKNGTGTPDSKVNGTTINGVWEFTAKDGLKHTIAHIGHLLVELKDIDNFLIFKYYPIFIVDENSQYDNITKFELEDYKSKAFVAKNKLYILGGNKFLVLSKEENSDWEINEVEDNAYIPTTTIGITYADSQATGQTVLDDVNLLTQWRKNKLVSGTYYDDGSTLRTTRFWDWTLDTSVKTKTDTDINNIRVQISSLKEE